MNFTCFLAAVLFLVDGILDLLFMYGRAKRPPFSVSDWMDLEPKAIDDEFKWNQDTKALSIASGFVGSFAWFVLCFPLIQLTWILSDFGQRKMALHAPIGILIIFGCFTEWLSVLWFVGTFTTSQFIYERFNLHDWDLETTTMVAGQKQPDGDFVGLRIALITKLAAFGVTLFVDAFEWIALSLAMLLIFVSVKQLRSVDATVPFTGCWNALGLFIALLSVLEWVAEIVSLGGVKQLSSVSRLYAVINRIFLLPLWLLLLSFSLPKASLKGMMLGTSAQPQEQPQPTTTAEGMDPTTDGDVPAESSQVPSITIGDTGESQ